MVAQNPLFRARWRLRWFQATVIKDVWFEVVLFTLVAAMVSLVSKKTDTSLGISSQLLTVLGTILGLVISFRTSSAYARYQDCLKLWTNIDITSRNLAQMIWIHVSEDRSDKNQTLTQVIIEKKSMISLIQAFAVSVKHSLRGEPGIYYEDLYPLISFLPQFTNPDFPHEKSPLWRVHERFEDTHMTSEDKSNQSRPTGVSFRSRHTTLESEGEQPLMPARNPPPSSIVDYIPLFGLFEWIGRTILRRPETKLGLSKQRRRLRNPDVLVESHVPSEIVLVLSNYTAYLMKNGLVQPAIATGLTNSLTILHDTLSNLERTRHTPLPFAYQTHLKGSLWLYLFFLPFQVYTPFGYLTIPATAFASFLLLGFLQMLQEIENPFNYDLNDLDLDHFCLSLQRELYKITAYACSDPSDFLYSNRNQPFAPADRRGADELARFGGDYRHPDNRTEPGLQSIRRTLASSWREVDLVTRPYEGP